MCDHLGQVRHLKNEKGVSIPADFRCPLSLELMADPVIVASGQTYERAYIQEWLDQGMTTCPKTGQTLQHTHLIPNFTVKALIASWCEANNFPKPQSIILPICCTQRILPKPALDLSNRRGGFLSVEINRDKSPGNNSDALCVSHQESFREQGNASQRELTKSVCEISEEISISSTFCDASMNAPSPSPKHPAVTGHNRGVSYSSFASSFDDGQASTAEEGNSDVSGEIMPPNFRSGAAAAATSASASHSIEREIPDERAGSTCSSMSCRQSFDDRKEAAAAAAGDISSFQLQVTTLIRDLESGTPELERSAAGKLRLLAKYNSVDRTTIARCGAIKPLVTLLHSSDQKTQENAVTALLNLSINDDNKTEIAAAGAIYALIHVLKTGNPEGKENAAAAVFSLSVSEEIKIKIGQSGAVPPLVELLRNGSLRGKKDAATALFKLSICHENKARIVRAGAVRYLVELMDAATGMADKAVAVLCNLSSIPEGRKAIGEDAAGAGIPALVELLELGSQRGKENAAATLLQLCTNSNKFRRMVLQEGAIPPLVALSQTGTPRAKEKAHSLLRLFRDQRRSAVVTSSQDAEAGARF